MTDLPNPAHETDSDATAPAPEAAAVGSGDPELAALVRPPTRPPLDADPELAALVRLGQRPVSAAVPPPATAVPQPGAGAAGPASPALPTAEPTALPTAEPVAEPTAELPTAQAEPAAPVAAAIGGSERRDRGRSLALRFALAFVLGVLLIVGAGAGALYAWGQQYDGRILPGVRVGTTDLSGLTREEAQSAIAKAYASLGTGTIRLTGPDGQVTISYADIGRGPDTAAILSAALVAGRQGEPLADLVGAPQAALRGVTVASAVVYDRAKLAAAVAALSRAIDQPATDAAVASGAAGFTVSPAADGRAVDRATLLVTLDKRLSALDAPDEIDLDVPVGPVAPTVATSAAEAAKAAADRMASDLLITRGSDQWTIASAALRPLISFSPNPDGTVDTAFSGDGLDPILAGLAKKVNQAPQNAGLALSGKRVVATGPGREGRSLSLPAMKAAIVSQMAARAAGTAVEPLAAAVTSVDPPLSTALAQQSASKMVVIGQHTTWFPIWIGNGYGANIWVPAKLLNGYVLAPGQTFDFWKVIGTPTAAQGFTQGNAIINGRTSITGAFAGGICSCSTTLFNAALEAGLKMGPRQNHYYFIPRYPTGLDATVWISGGAKQSMSFTNDTPYPVLIQGVNTRSGGTGYVTFKIWSVPNGRKVQIGQAVVKNFHKASDSTVYTARLPKGTSERVQDPEDGFDAWRTVTVKNPDGSVRWSTTYYSHYATVTGVVEVGTGGDG